MAVVTQLESFVDDETRTDLRRFGVRDVLFLVATSAVAVGACRYFDPDWNYLGNRYGYMRYARTAATAFTLAIFGLIVTGELPLRQAIRYPGRSSILTIVLVFPFVALTDWTTIFVLLDEPLWTAIRKFVLLAFSLSDRNVQAYCAVSAWAVLVLRRDAIWSRDWIELSCLAITAFWIAFALLYLFIGEFESWVEELA